MLLLLLLSPLQATAESTASTATRSETTVDLPPGKLGGRLVVALRAEPKTFNPSLTLDSPSETVVNRMMADLLHIHRDTQQVEPSLAESWTLSPDGKRFELQLRSGLRFSDGHPVDTEDVEFTFQVHQHPEATSLHHKLLQVGGEPIRVEKLDDRRLAFHLSAPSAVGERLFDNLAILPAHRLKKAFEEGRLPQVWGIDSKPEDIVGLGPFRLRQYQPGEKLVLERNPYYWKVDQLGQRLPYLDELVFLFVPSEEAQTLRLQAGETHLIDRLSAASFDRLKQHEQLRMLDLGPSLNFEFLFFNLNDLEGLDLLEVRDRQSWFNEVRFRRAISLAIDRPGIVKLAYRGRATPILSHVTGGNKLWATQSLAPGPPSLAEARIQLKEAGFSWDDGGRLKDPSGEFVAFTIVTNSGNSQRERIATVVQEDLRRLGMDVNIVPLEFAALVDRLFKTFDFDVCLLGLGGGDPDPNASMDIVRSDGTQHLWQLRPPKTLPAWQEEIDKLMKHQLSEIDRVQRKKSYDRVQQILSEQLPWIPLISPNVLVGADEDLRNFRPAVMPHLTLWNADELFWRRDPSANH